MTAQYEAFTPPLEIENTTERTVRAIEIADSHADIERELQKHTLADVLGGFPFPFPVERDEGPSDAARYYQMVAAMVAGDPKAAEAYNQTAQNFRPYNARILSALRESEEITNEQLAPATDAEIDLFGWQTDAGGLALRALYAREGVNGMNGQGIYMRLAKSVVDTIVAAKIGIAVHGDLR